MPGKKCTQNPATCDYSEFIYSSIGSKALKYIICHMEEEKITHKKVVFDKCPYKYEKSFWYINI